jgi:hypothetical protein
VQAIVVEAAHAFVFRFHADQEVAVRARGRSCARPAERGPSAPTTYRALSALASYAWPKRRCAPARAASRVSHRMSAGVSVARK